MTIHHKNYGEWETIFSYQEDFVPKEIVAPGTECRIFQREEGDTPYALFNYLDSEGNEVQDVQECYIDKKERELHIEYMREVLLSRGYIVTWAKKQKKTKSRMVRKFRTLDYKIGAFYVVEDIDESMDGKRLYVTQYPFYTLKDARDFVSFAEQEND